MTRNQHKQAVKLYKRMRSFNYSHSPYTGEVYQFACPAQFAWKTAKYTVTTRDKWEKAESKGLVKLEYQPDELCNFEDLCGDTFNPKANPDIPPARLEKERQVFLEKCNRDGVWGIVGKYFDGETWQIGGSIWGIVGEDKETEIDVMGETLDALGKLRHCPKCGRPIVK